MAGLAEAATPRLRVLSNTTDSRTLKTPRHCPLYMEQKQASMQAAGDFLRSFLPDFVESFREQTGLVLTYEGTNFKFWLVRSRETEQMSYEALHKS